MKFRINPHAIYTVKKVEGLIFIIADANSDDKVYSLKGPLFDLFLLFENTSLTLQELHNKFDDIFIDYDDSKRNEMDQSFEKLKEYGLIISAD